MSETNGSIQARKDRDFRILQLTDFHNDTSDEAAACTYADIRALVEAWQPDFLVVTGDIWCGDDKPNRGSELMDRDIEFLGTLGVPWAFAWGNHDYVNKLESDTARIAASQNACMPTGDGRGNFRVGIKCEGRPAWDLYFLNSHREGLWPQDLRWLRTEAERIVQERGERTPAIAFFHIPLEQYERARLAGAVQGIAQEEVLYWGNSADRFDAIRDAGTIRACFVGHSHVNDFWFEEEGVVLAYGRATGHGGYGADRLTKGAKLIELDSASGRFTFKTVFSDGSACLTREPPHSAL